MLHRRLPLTSLVVAALAAALFAAPVVAAPALTASLTGASEVPSADPDGSGTVVVRVNTGKGVVCYELTVTGIDTAIAAHIHHAPAGVNGPVVVPLQAPSEGSSSGCVEVVRSLAKDIASNPADYYVNVHNIDYPAGAIRGQLSK